MMQRFKITRCFMAQGALFLVLGVLGCGAPSHAIDREDVPEWTNRSAGPAMEDGRRVFYAVGLVSGVRNMALARTTAENRARAEMQKYFTTYSASLMRDYQAATAAGDVNESSEEQHIEATVKTFSAGSLSGVAIVDRWYDRETQTVYALARLDLAAVEDAVAQMRELNPKVKAYVRANARRAFDELQKEEDRRSNSD